MKTVNLTCVECPMGCAIEVQLDGESVVSVVGNTCPRGLAYAKNEVVCPMRVLTTTVKSTDGRMVSVKTDNPIKKSNMFSLMQVINGITVTAPVKIGDIIMKNIEGDVNLVATDCLK
ncbi:MAG: DUF1667 domain-containing protein [Clostridia bacterium]|nr:DUF1667 domain-containing protein [Clostridia bacterium]